jgi:hypothetical protein
MKKSFLILASLFLTSSCATVQAPGFIDITSLKGLFKLCESDLEKAKKVIIDKDLVKILSHLQKMDSGGKKYYLLEREAITAMIKAVTEGVYSDFILLNRDGTVVYTMVNDKLFAGNVRTTLAKSALSSCYENREVSPYIASVPHLPADAGAYVAVSSKVQGGNTMPGIFILIIDTQKIQKIIGKKSYAIGSNGMYEVAADRQIINTRYRDFDKIDLSNSRDELAVRSFSRSSGATAHYRFFNYSNLSWILITE